MHRLDHVDALLSLRRASLGGQDARPKNFLFVAWSCHVSAVSSQGGIMRDDLHDLEDDTQEAAVRNLGGSRVNSRTTASHRRESTRRYRQALRRYADEHAPRHAPATQGTVDEVEELVRGSQRRLLSRMKRRALEPHERDALLLSDLFLKRLPEIRGLRPSVRGTAAFQFLADPKQAVQSWTGKRRMRALRVLISASEMES